jgi:3-oxoacyl-[acyl-carrier protein] reductase
MPVLLSLEGKVALVTGGSRGIGAAIVRMSVRAGARVFFNYEKAAEAAEKLCRECGTSACAAQACGLDSSEAARELVSSCVRRSVSSTFWLRTTASGHPTMFPWTG